MNHFGLNMTLREYFADAVVHVTGVVAALVGATALLVWASLSLPLPHIPPLVVYSIGLIACFAFSAAYNMTVHPRARAVLQRFDHAFIFVMIAGTYTPVALLGIGGAWGITLVVIAWILAGAGVVLRTVFTNHPEKLALALYLAQGWLAVVAIVPMLRELNVSTLILVGLGGLIYTVGTMFCYRDKLPYNKAIWHVFVLAASALHYSAILTVAAPA